MEWLQGKEIPVSHSGLLLAFPLTEPRLRLAGRRVEKPLQLQPSDLKEESREVAGLKGEKGREWISKQTGQNKHIFLVLDTGLPTDPGSLVCLGAEKTMLLHPQQHLLVQLKS